MFLEPLGAGAIVLLTLLLLVSTLIAVWHFRRVNTASEFLIADYQAKWYDFTASQIAYVVGVATVIVLFPSLAYTYGPVFILTTAVAWIITLSVVFAFLGISKELNAYLVTNYGLPNFIAGNFEEGRGRTFLLLFSSVIIALIYWGLFGIELIALRTIFDGMFPNVSTLPILILSFLLVIIYVNLGGYLSTLRTDCIQTLIFIGIMVYFALSVLPEQFRSVHIPNIISSEIFSKSPNISWTDVCFFGIGWLLLGIGFLLVSQDLWSRSAASSQRSNLRNTFIGLVVSILAIIPFAAIAVWGLYMFALEPKLARPGDLEQIIAKLINQMGGKAPVGLLLATLIAIAISTADTALMTSTQAINGIKSQWLNTLWKCRIWTVVLGLLGLLTAFAFPSIISGVFTLSSLPLVFLPLIFARMMKRGRKIWAANTVIVLGTIIALSAGLLGKPEVAQFYPILVFFFSLVFYPLFQIIPIGRKQ